MLSVAYVGNYNFKKTKMKEKTDDCKYIHTYIYTCITTVRDI